MKTKSLMTFFLSAVLLTALGLASISTSSQNIFAQSNNNNTTTNAMAGRNMTADNNSTMMMNGDQNMGKGNDYQKHDAKQNHEKINGTINMMNTMYQALGSKFNVSLSQAISTAEQTIGNGSNAMSANGEERGGFLVYSIIVGTPDMKFYNVIVDPGNGQVLASNEISMMEWMMTMHSGQNQDMNMMMGMHHGYDMQGMMGNYQKQW